MRITEGDTSRSVYFVAVDSVDYVTRETGLASWVVYYSIDGGAATSVGSPTVSEVDSTNMPGVYKLALNVSGMVTLGAGVESGELVLHLSHTGAAPITRVLTVERGVSSLVLGASLGFGGSLDASVEEALQAAWVQGRGKWAISGGVLTLYEPDETTPLVVLDLDDPQAPSSRTPR